LITSNNVTINEIRYKLVIKAFQFGERPAIDTTEALTQLLSFQYQKNQRWLEFQNAGLALSAYLWKENSQPYLLPEYVIPEGGWDNEQLIKNYTVQFPDLLNTATDNHPELKVYDAKLRALQVEKRLKQQALLPKIDLKYHQLGKGYNVLSSGPVLPLFENNFKYGLNFEMPLRLSEGRGDYKKTRLKIEETTLLQSQKRLQVELKIRSYYNELLYLQNQITLQANNYANYQKMVQAEEIKIQNGESTLFLLNSRETKALEALEKLIELKTKFHKTVYALQWSAGSLQ
jgi:outer membrane protein TolC